ncbi:hypothetical protein HF895_10675, partial [Bacteroides sp. AN502]|nr:hypothetical protein [Caecibacteroides pullorum]
LGQPVEQFESFSERWDSPSNSSKASPSVGTARRTVRKLLRTLGQPVEQFKSFSERWGGPSNCSTDVRACMFRCGNSPDGS